MEQKIIEDFNHEFYGKSDFSLPARFSDYKMISCLQHSPGRWTCLLEHKTSNTRVICKYATEEFAVMLHKEQDIFSYRKGMKRFKFLPYVIDCFDLPEGTYLVREYIEGETLLQIVEREGFCSLERAVFYMLKVCECFIKLHSENPPLIYRDLKASNILFTSSDECYILDMGTIRNYREDVSVDTSFMGTSAVAAPEQYGFWQTDKRTDIYGFGMLFYYLLAGELLHVQEKDKSSKIGFFIKNRSAARIIQKCTAFDPENRYPDMESVKKDLEKLNGRLGATDGIKKHKKEKLVSSVGWGLSVVLSVIILVMILNRSWQLSEAPMLKNSYTAMSQTDGILADDGNDKNEISDSSSGNDSEGNKTKKSVIQNSEEEVVFTSQLMEEAVRVQLGKHNGELITYDDLSRITSLFILGKRACEYAGFDDERQDSYAVHGDVEDLKIISQMENLKILFLEGQNITDISPLQGLPLICLSLRDNPLSDISALYGNETLQMIDLNCTEIDSLEDLSACKNLNKLYCSDTDILSFAPIASLPVHKLVADNVPASDYETLVKSEINDIWVSHVPIEKIKDLANISELISLTIEHSDIERIDQLSMFSGLRGTLSVYDDKVSSLEGIENFTNIDCLNIAYNSVKDGTPLKKLTNLRELSINKNPLEDYMFLNDMRGLEKLYISQEQMSGVYRDVKNPWFEIIVE